jgi:hypothetical protein
MRSRAAAVAASEAEAHGMVTNVGSQLRVSDVHSDVVSLIHTW